MNRPHMIADASLHRRGHPEGLYAPIEVVVHMKQRDHGNVISEFLAKGIRQARKAPYVYSHVEILPLYIAGADMVGIRRPNDSIASGPKTLRRAVAMLSFGIGAVNLHQLRLVNVRRERIGCSRQIHLVA